MTEQHTNTTNTYIIILFNGKNSFVTKFKPFINIPQSILPQTAKQTKYDKAYYHNRQNKPSSYINYTCLFAATSHFCHVLLTPLATMLSFIHVLNLLTHQFLLLFQISLLYKLPVKIYKSLSCNNTRWTYDHNLQDEFWISLRQVISDRGHKGLIAWSISSNRLL